MTFPLGGFVMARTLVDDIRSVRERFELSDVELSALSGVSVPVIRAARLRGRLPRREPSLRKLQTFADRAQRAHGRKELTLP